MVNVLDDTSLVASILGEGGIEPDPNFPVLKEIGLVLPPPVMQSYTIVSDISRSELPTTQAEVDAWKAKYANIDSPFIQGSKGKIVVSVTGSASGEQKRLAIRTAVAKVVAMGGHLLPPPNTTINDALRAADQSGGKPSDYMVEWNGTTGTIYFETGFGPVFIIAVIVVGVLALAATTYVAIDRITTYKLKQEVITSADERQDEVVTAALDLINKDTTLNTDQKLDDYLKLLGGDQKTITAVTGTSVTDKVTSTIKASAMWLAVGAVAVLVLLLVVRR